jgi:hypothetical protein
VTRLRRAVSALLVGVLLLQVTVLGAAGACVRSAVVEAGPAIDARVAPSAHGAHGGHGGHDMARHDGAGHDRPAVPGGAPDGVPGGVPAHCPMAMSCVLAGLTAGAHALPVDTPAPRLVIAARDDVLPASARRAPEPPPPRG